MLVELTKLIADSHDGAQLLQNPYDNPICKLSFDEDIECIEVVWRKYATSAQLRFVNETILGMLVRYKVANILGDDTELPIIHAEDQRWIIEQWLPRAQALGFTTGATVLSRTFFGRAAIGAIQSTLASKVQFRNFPDVHSARNWLKSATAGTARSMNTVIEG